MGGAGFEPGVTLFGREILYHGRKPNLRSRDITRVSLISRSFPPRHLWRYAYIVAVNIPSTIIAKTTPAMPCGLVFFNVNWKVASKTIGKKAMNA